MATKKKKRGRPKGSKTRPKTGRPLRLTAKVRDEICALLREGNYIETAAAFVGVSKASVYSWMKQGHQAREREERGEDIGPEDRAYIAFLDALKKAEADAEVEAVRFLNLMRGEAWQTVAWRLERRHPDKWGRKQAIEHSSPADKPVRVQRVVIGGQTVEF